MRRIFVPLFSRWCILYCTIIGFLLCSCKSSTCSKTIPCPGYNDTLLNTWFPYHSHQQLFFKSSTNLYDTLYLQLADSTKPYEDTTGGYNPPPPSCSATKSLLTSKKDSSDYPLFSISLNDYSGGYSTTDVRSALFYFSNNGFFGQNLTDNGFSGFTLYYGVESAIFNVLPQTLYNYSSNGIIYPLAQSITNDSVVNNNISGVYKVIYAKNAGIVEYETNPGGIVWIKQ
jgi:hypothetical protein